MDDSRLLSLVKIVWADAHVYADVPISIENLADYHRPTKVTTIGWVLRHDEIGISIVNEFYDGAYRGLTFIPAAMLITVSPYKLSKPRNKKTPPT